MIVIFCFVTKPSFVM